MKTVTKPKLTKLVNPLNGQVWFCENYHETKWIDGVEFIKVHDGVHAQTFLMRKDALQKK